MHVLLYVEYVFADINHVLLQYDQITYMMLKMYYQDSKTASLRYISMFGELRMPHSIMCFDLNRACDSLVCVKATM